MKLLILVLSMNFMVFTTAFAADIQLTELQAPLESAIMSKEGSFSICIVRVVFREPSPWRSVFTIRVNCDGVHRLNQDIALSESSLMYTVVSSLGPAFNKAGFRLINCTDTSSFTVSRRECIFSK